MDRTAQEIVEGVLACIPDSAPEKEVLKRRFDEILVRRVPDPKFAAPEVRGFYNQRKILDICAACSEVLGDPSGADWKQRVVEYLAAGV